MLVFEKTEFLELEMVNYIVWILLSCIVEGIKTEKCSPFKQVFLFDI